MPKLAVEINLQQIEQMIAQLRTQERIHLIQRLEQKAWGERFRSVTARIDRRRKRYPISRKRAMSLVKEARRERYAGRH